MSYSFTTNQQAFYLVPLGGVLCKFLVLRRRFISMLISLTFQLCIRCFMKFPRYLRSNKRELRPASSKEQAFLQPLIVEGIPRLKKQPSHPRPLGLPQSKSMNCHMKGVVEDKECNPWKMKRQLNQKRICFKSVGFWDILAN